MISLQIIWDTHEAVMIEETERNLEIRDIPQKWVPRICDYMLEHSYRQNAIFQQLKFDKMPELEEDYLRAINHILRDECSIMVIDKETNEIFGVALVKWMTDIWRSWTIWLQVVPNGKLAEFLLLQRNFVLDYEKMHPEHMFDGLHLFEYYLCDELKHDDLFMDKFFNAVCEVARHMLMPRVTFVGASSEQQQDADAAGFTRLTHIIYALILDNGRRPFQSLRDIGEMYMVLFERYVVPITPFYDMPPPNPYDDDDREQHTRGVEEFVLVPPRATNTTASIPELAMSKSYV